MKDKALKTLKFMVIFLNFLLIAGVVFFIVTAAKLITKSECEDFNYLANDHDNVKISFSEKKIFIEEKIDDEYIISVLDNCSGDLQNKITVKEYE